MRPVSLPIWPHPLSGNHLARVSRLARASALLLMQLQQYRDRHIRSRFTQRFLPFHLSLRQSHGGSNVPDHTPRRDRRAAFSCAT